MTDVRTQLAVVAVGLARTAMRKSQTVFVNAAIIAIVSQIFAAVKSVQNVMRKWPIAFADIVLAPTAGSL